MSLTIIIVFALIIECKDINKLYIVGCTSICENYNSFLKKNICNTKHLIEKVTKNQLVYESFAGQHSQ